MAQIEIIQERLRERLKTLNLSARSVSMKALGTPDAINNILNKRATPSYERLDAIARELGTSVMYLSGSKDTPEADILHVAEGAPPLPNPSDMAKDIPVYGSAVGGLFEGAGIDGSQDENSVELTFLNSGEVIDFFRRPPALLTNRSIYGLYVAGSSMEPVFESGDAVIVDPRRPPAIREFVVVYLSNPPFGNGAVMWSDRDPSSVLLKRLVRRSASYVELEQYNPAGSFRVPIEQVTAMHRVLTTAEMLGV